MTGEFSSLYARFYDVLYGGKDYSKETDYFEKLLKKEGLRKGSSILTLGAGTLNHEAHLARKGYRVHGVELSRDMVARAQEKIRSENLSVTIEQGDMRTYEPRDKYDAVLIPFNVVSYCGSKKELVETLRRASSALKKGGVLAFDCWNAEVMKKDPPQDTWAKITLSRGVLYKLVSASAVRGGAFVRTQELVAVEGTHCETYREEHRLHGWTAAEMKSGMNAAGLSLKHVYEWLTSKPVSAKRWAMTIVAVRK